MSELQEQIKVVVEARVGAANTKEIVAQLRERWEIEYKVAIDKAGTRKQELDEAEAKLRDLTLQAYAETGNKAPAEGVSVKIFQALSYEREEAMKWASEHRVALKLDTATFEKIAKVDKPSFVTIADEPRAQIAKNLEVSNA